MNIHEYQAKELLKKFDVATTRGRVASTLDEAEQIARELGDIDIVVKAQIHAGGRGKGTFTKRIQRRSACSQDASGSARCRGNDARSDPGYPSDRTGLVAR
jgi:succinyl-CoA synthetase beta subunit